MKQIEEIYWLRFYGCLAVFAFHLIDRIEHNYLEHTILDLARIPTVVGTPIFIFISVFLFSLRYLNEVPHHFLARRLKYIMIPYVVYGLIYSLAEYVRLHMSGENVSLAGHLVEYLVFAGWHGYFLIVAMQFYLLFWCYSRFRLSRWLPAGPACCWAPLSALAGGACSAGLVQKLRDTCIGLPLWAGSTSSSWQYCWQNTIQHFCNSHG